jgi:hypothetical protein
MKTILLSLMLVFTSALYSQNEDVKQVVVTFFKGFHAKDSITMKSVCADKMILQSISESSKVTQLKKIFFVLLQRYPTLFFMKKNY